MDNPIQVDLGRIAQDLQIRRVQVESVVHLLDEGNTVAFITRYRKERTGNLNEVVIREIQVRIQRLRDLAERKETILKAIDKQGKLTPELDVAIRSAENLKRLEDLYLPFKAKKRTKASEARERGLEPLAARIWNRDETLTDLPAAAAEFVDAEKGVDSPEKALEGVRHILAEAISEMAAVREAVRKAVWKTGKLVTTKGEVPEGQGLEYRDYFDYSEPVAQVPPHRVLAINRGDKEGPLKVKLEVSRPDLESAFFGQLPLEGHPQADAFHAAAVDALERLILPSMEREVRHDLTEAAEKHAVDVFARNLRSLLLQPPIPKQVVLAIDPGLRSGCKVAVLDPNGNLLEQGIVYPHAPQGRRSEAKVFIKDLVGKYQVGVVAIGNGTACRETEELVAEIIAEGHEFSTNPEARAAAEAAVAAAASRPVAEPQHEAPAESGDDEAPSEHDDEAPAEETPQVDETLQVDETPQVDETSYSEAESPAVDEHQAHPHDLQEEAMTAEAPAADPGPYIVPDDAEDEDEADDGVAAPHDLQSEELPPISGGAPESTSPETQAGEEVHEGANNHPAHPTADASHEAPPSPAHEAPESPVAEAAPAAEAHAHAPEAAADAPAGETPAEVPAGDVVVEHQAVPVPAEGGESAATPTPTSSRHEGDRHRGEGQGRRGKSRGSRSRNQPPPPQTPPAPHAADAQLAQLAYVIVNEAGASVYSASPIGREELPEFDATLRSAISIGRRLQDPLSELVKIEPQNIGVGLYQHDVSPKQLKDSLDAVIASCVNFVGVDLNTASVPLLRYVSGLNQLTARRIADRRKEKGPFANREELIEVEGVGPATFTQAAGFLKIGDGPQPLDRTWIHPESYAAASRLLEKFESAPDVVRDKEKLPELRARLAEADVPAIAQELEVGEPTLKDIIEALGRPDRDPRDDLPKPIFKKGILKLEDLTAGMELKGTVLNVVDFGAFVDIGLKDSGLVHISQLANRYIKSPHDVVSVGDVVTVWVMSVDQDRKRVSLTMVKPGTERHRGAGQGGGGGRRGEGAPQQQGQGGEGQARRGRGPRPGPSNLTNPPVGAPPIDARPEGGGDAGPRRFAGPAPSGPAQAPGQGGGYRTGSGGPSRAAIVREAAAGPARVAEAPRRRRLHPRRRRPVRRPSPRQSQRTAGRTPPGASRPPAPSPLQGRPHRQRPAPHVRPA
ncbi:Tex-like N-terminal domain-containing protein [Paludisphaera mucosa]|uniref:Tex-like N-terminal domain-containing protein n=1 Tax=Paludisphaera mucosa TaxID=3030827 RepID=A0ABT6FID8_9BACT|nr:Tex-like N-terminal domain-containing protein [Paludisphaera mucosa]MDG3007332.1 Tex-like N-terminal domain-containing protein [Paludisphaera mucosa]